MPVASSPGPIFTPTATKTPTPTNYLDGDDFDFLNQYLPETDKIIVERFGSQMITGMLETLGKEKTFKSDNIKWKEEARLTELCTGVTRSGNVFTLNGHTIRANETIYARNDDGSVERKGVVSSVTTNTFTVLCGNAAGWTALGTTAITLYAFGSEFQKGTDGMQQSLNSQFSSFEVTPVITKEMVKESGSNLALMTWIYVSPPEGSGYKSGWCWYYKNYNDTTKRFKNKIESERILGESWAGDALAAGYQGTQGLFSAMREGNIFEGAMTDKDDADEVIERMNKQGGISQNYLYCTTAQSASISDFLKAESVTAMSWGAFNNSEEMALKLDFKGFHRSGYEFYTSRWRFLDDPITQGSNVGASKVHAAMIPSASKQVYDIQSSTSTTEPVLQNYYRVSEEVNRKYEMSVRDFKTGTSNGNDSTTTDFQSEGLLKLISRNNTIIFQG